jgi:transcriptional regulator with XRE-family HTH domain
MENCRNASERLNSWIMTPESQHLLNVLRSAVRILGYTYNDVATKLGVGSGYLSRLFAGKIELKVDHVVNIAKAIGFEPEELMHLAWPQPRNPPSLAAARYRELIAGAEPARRPGAWPAEPSAEGDLEAAVAKALQRILAPAAPPRPAISVTTEEDVEKIVERMLRKFFGNLAQVKAE